MTQTILLVEGLEQAQFEPRQVLSERGYVVVVAKTVTAALALTAESKPDLILLDHRIADGDRLAFLRHLPYQVDDGGPPVVMLTHADEEQVFKRLPNVVERALREHTDERTRQAVERQLPSAASVYQNFAEGIMVCLPDGTIVSANPALCAMTGYLAEELVGRNPRILQSGRHDADFYLALWSQLRREGRWQGELWDRHKNGNHFVVRETITAINDVHGSLQNYVGVFVDVTHAKKVEHELAQQRLHLEEVIQQRTATLMKTVARSSLILQSCANGLYGVDLYGRITFISPMACSMLGYRADDVIGHQAHTLFQHSRANGTSYPLSECPSFTTLRLGKAIRVDNEVYWHVDGHAIPVMYSTRPVIENDEITGAVISFVDISDQRAATQAREQALLAAENLTRMRREFLSNISHEIRTPLNGVLGFAQIGSQSCQSNDKAKRAFEMIQESGHRLAVIVDDLLDFSKIEAGKLDVVQTPVLLNQVIEQTLEQVSAHAKAKQLELLVELTPDLPRHCMGDPMRLGQILLNLLSNAVKFTETGCIKLLARMDGDKLVFKVSDTGIGMNGEQVNQVFNPFQQADSSSTRRFGGTGLGLAITKRLLELMHGDIRVESQLGVGSSFEVRLPYVPVGALGQVPALLTRHSLVDKPLAGISILIAEDNKINRLVLEEHLTAVGARVAAVSNGQEAVEQVIRDGRNAYDVVLMDVQMPVMDGYEATKRIIDLVPDLPVIAQTAHAFSEERQKCLEAGMVDLIIKPIDRLALVNLVRKWRIQR